MNNQILIVANWKMNPKTQKEALALFEAVKKGIKNIKGVQVVICPPYLWINDFSSSGSIKIGAQNCSWEDQGAKTGEVSAPMLADAGAEYVILGHSERRKFLGETDEIINLKIKRALKAKMKVILCLGEREGEDMGSVVEAQMTGCLTGISPNYLKNIIFVYEPVWAIGTGNACQADNALSAGLFIKKTVAKIYGSRFIAEKITILYGGSADAANSKKFIEKAMMNGLLVGGASLKHEEFINLIKNCCQ